MLVQYVKDLQDNTIGVVIGVDREEMSWSLLSKGDKFSRKVALELAKNRFKEHSSAPETRNSTYWIREIYNGIIEEYKGQSINPYWNFLITSLLKMEKRTLGYFKEGEKK